MLMITTLASEATRRYTVRTTYSNESKSSAEKCFWRSSTQKRKDCSKSESSSPFQVPGTSTPWHKALSEKGNRRGGVEDHGGEVRRGEAPRPAQGGVRQARKAAAHRDDARGARRRRVGRGGERRQRRWRGGRRGGERKAHHGVCSRSVPARLLLY